MKQQVNPYRILVVEDNPGDYVLLEEYLQLSKLPVEKIIHALNMNAAISLVKDTIFDIAFLDLSLPDSSGIKSVISLNRLLPKTPIIVLSGLSTIEIAIESISLGAQDYLVKGEYDEKMLAKSVQYSIERNVARGKLQKSNELYEYVNKATQDTIWEWDYLAKEGLWGNGIINTFGYSKDKLKYDENWVKEYIHPADKQHMANSIESYIKSGKENWHDEYRFLCADGSYKEVFDRGFILYNENKKPYRMIGSMTDLTEKKMLEKELISQQMNQQKMMTEVAIQAQEKEKNELGRELHDNIAQLMATIKIYLGVLISGSGSKEDLLGKSYEYINSAIEETRKLSHSLVAPSLGELGLKNALEELLKDLNLSKSFHLHLLIDKKYDEQAKDKSKELALYRIVQEQLNNINKYAQATEVFINLKSEDGNLSLSVSDNGVGFDTTVTNNGIGLKNIDNRVKLYSGTMNIISAPGQGCNLQVFIPV
ncbi:MAG: PAS domain-containing protein [Bacteroidota bacterium]|nr:PAS domain-containing protein [Bacteroidota bacterium]